MWSGRLSCLPSNIEFEFFKVFYITDIKSYIFLKILQNSFKDIDKFGVTKTVKCKFYAIIVSIAKSIFLDKQPNLLDQSTHVESMIECKS